MQYAIPVPTKVPRSIILIDEPYSKQTTDIPLSVVVKDNGTIRILSHRTDFHRRDVESLANCYPSALSALLDLDTNVARSLDGCMSDRSMAILKTFLLT